MVEPRYIVERPILLSMSLEKRLMPGIMSWRSFRKRDCWIAIWAFAHSLN
jgi:hypothetical protein